MKVSFSRVFYLGRFAHIVLLTFPRKDKEISGQRVLMTLGLLISRALATFEWSFAVPIIDKPNFTVSNNHIPPQCELELHVFRGWCIRESHLARRDLFIRQLSSQCRFTASPFQRITSSNSHVLWCNYYHGHFAEEKTNTNCVVPICKYNFENCECLKI